MRSNSLTSQCLVRTEAMNNFYLTNSTSFKLSALCLEKCATTMYINEKGYHCGYLFGQGSVDSIESILKDKAI